MDLPTVRLRRARPLVALALAAILCAAPAGAQAWHQLGTNIDGETESDHAGYSVSLSGNRVATGTIFYDGVGTDSGRARVFEWDGTAWTQLGANLDGEAAGDNAGESVSLSGNRVAVGASGNDGSGPGSGHARVYEWDGTAWTQLGADIDGEAAGDGSGWSVSLSGDRLAVGAPYNSENGPGSGHARVYEWDGTAWAQLGADLDGDAENDWAGYSVSLEGDQLAVGAPARNSALGRRGRTRVYEWIGTTWAQLGADLDGEAAGDGTNWSVSLSGDRVAVGSWLARGGGFFSGHARVFEWTHTAWVQLGAAVDGEYDEDFSGWTVSLDGDRLAVGALEGDGNVPDTGHARVFEFESVADADGDGVLDGDDFCSATVIPESVPTSRLTPNHWALVDSDFAFDTVRRGNGGGSGRQFDTIATGGCSCEQIIDQLDLGNGHTKHGCSNGAMDEWVAFVASSSPGAAAADARSLDALAADAGVPESDVLEAGYPNPFTARTTIRYGLSEASAVSLVVYDAMGRTVARLVEGTVGAGRHRVVFDASGLPSGVYLFRLDTPRGRSTRHLVLTR